MPNARTHPIGLRYEFKEQHTFGLAYGLHSQMAPLQFYYSQHRLSDGSVAQPNNDLDLTKSNFSNMEKNKIKEMWKAGETAVNVIAGRTPEGAFFLGDPNAPLTMIDYSDFL